MDLTTYNNDPICKPVESVGSRRPLSVLERLESRKQDLESDLSRVNEAITALKANPETMHVIECISKV